MVRNRDSINPLPQTLFEYPPLCSERLPINSESQRNLFNFTFPLVSKGEKLKLKDVEKSELNLNDVRKLFLRPYCIGRQKEISVIKNEREI
jgi:hypothetical protein